eukprot:scaffold2858_cov169-Alexandrium_tamarense.AAC.1
MLSETKPLNRVIAEKLSVKEEAIHLNYSLGSSGSRFTVSLHTKCPHAINNHTNTHPNNELTLHHPYFSSKPQPRFYYSRRSSPPPTSSSVAPLVVRGRVSWRFVLRRT